MVLFLIAINTLKLKTKKIQKIFIFYFLLYDGNYYMFYCDCGARYSKKNKPPAGLEPATLRLPC